MTETADIVLFTVNDFETQEVSRAFNKTTDARGKGPRMYWDYGEIGGARVVHALCKMGDLSAIKSAQAAIVAWQPSLVMGVGIGWGAKRDEHAIGTILVADPLVDAAHIKDTPSEGIQQRGDAIVQVDALRQIISTCHLDRHGLSPEGKAKLMFGPVLSLPTLLDNYDTRVRVLNAWPDAIGGEMEGRGMVDAAVERNCNWLVIKAICDWGYDKNAVDGLKERDQQIAAANAADFVRYAVEHGLASYAMHQRNERARAGAATNPPPNPPAAAPMFNIGVNHGTVAHTIHTQNVTVQPKP